MFPGAYRPRSRDTSINQQTRSMSQEEEQFARGHFKNIVQHKDLPERAWARETGKFGAGSKEVGSALGTKDLGYCVVSLDPGRVSCPYHFHHTEEEMFFVLSGVAILRQGDADVEEQLEVTVGDFASFPGGTGVAHQFINKSEQPFVYLAVSNRVKADVCEYPDSDKVAVRATGLILRRGPTLPYFDGEV